MLVPVAIVILLVAVSASEADSASTTNSPAEKSMKIEKYESTGFNHDFLNQEPVILDFSKKEPEPVIVVKEEPVIEPSAYEQINAVKTKSKSDCGDCKVIIREREYTYDPSTGYLMTDLSGEGAK